MEHAKGGDKTVSPRTGRPKSSNPLKNDVKIRFDDELYNRLLNYCENNHTTKTEVIRQAVIMLLDAKE